jgi:hypothetical protein
MFQPFALAERYMALSKTDYLCLFVCSISDAMDMLVESITRQEKKSMDAWEHDKNGRR